VDRDIVLKAQTGDSEALGLIYEKMYKRVYYLALKMTSSPEDAEDAAQETFIAAFDSLGNLEKPEAFESWLLQICANRCRNLLRKNSHTVALEEDEDGKTMLDDMADPNEELIPETAMQNEEQRRLILETVEALPKDQKECVYMFYFSGIGVKDIASEQGCSEGTVKSRLNYARAKIKESILAIEKRDGIRLYSFAPLALLFALDMDAVTAHISVPALGGLAAGASAVGGAAATTAAGSTATAAGTTAATTAKAAAGVALKTKIIAGVAATAVAAGGGVAIYEVAKAPEEPSPYVEFADANMEHNVHILLDIPMEEPIPRETLAEIEAVFFVEDGMALLNDDWATGWLDDSGELSTYDGGYWQPLYSVEQMSPKEGTLPVTDLVDLQYFGTDALWIGTLESETVVDTTVLESLFPECQIRNTPKGGIKIPFHGAVYWTETGEVRINSDAQIEKLGSYTMIRNPEYVTFADADMERNMHILLEIPDGEAITTYEMGGVHQVQFYEGEMDMFAGYCWTWEYIDTSGTCVPENFEDMKYFNQHFLLISVPHSGYVDEEAILAVCPHTEFHYFMAGIFGEEELLPELPDEETPPLELAEEEPEIVQDLPQATPTPAISAPVTTTPPEEVEIRYVPITSGKIKVNGVTGEVEYVDPEVVGYYSATYKAGDIVDGNTGETVYIIPESVEGPAASGFTDDMEIIENIGNIEVIEIDELPDEVIAAINAQKDQ